MTFIGQTMASTVMPYQMMSMGGMTMQGSGMQKGAMESTSSQMQEMSHGMAMMDHSSHNMPNHLMLTDADSTETTSQEEQNEDCCSTICKCFTGGCSSLATLPKELTPVALGYFSPKIHSISNLAFSLSSTSLYRPPILS
ncbi:hypothetical protein BTO11_13145 [Psychrosphaera saromensis]|uniref:Uncharacterized protein n=2 Tax=Psychrosphaera saromensis TaxID=716813 RepID=A0A2S7V189_9GAMM|nr:hypothetical protein BTO11_13145 [Psychrosphaera saromensis]